MKVALVQEAPVLNDPAANLALIETYVGKAKAAGADLVIFPELFVTGYSIPVAFAVGYHHEPYLESLQNIAHAHNLWCVVGYPEKAEDGRLYNTAALISPSGLVGQYRKVHLFGREPEIFSPGNSFPAFDTPWGRVGILICYDLEFPEAARALALRGARLVIAPTANMIPWQEYQTLYTRVRAMENGIFVAVANRVGTEGETTFCGSSALAGPDGKWVIPPAEADGLLTGEVDFSNCETLPEAVRYLTFRRPDTYLPLVNEVGSV